MAYKSGRNERLQIYTSKMQYMDLPDSKKKSVLKRIVRQLGIPEHVLSYYIILRNYS
jgi:hypothetical protein